MHRCCLTGSRDKFRSTLSPEMPTASSSAVGIVTSNLGGATCFVARGLLCCFHERVRHRENGTRKAHRSARKIHVRSEPPRHSSKESEAGRGNSNTASRPPRPIPPTNTQNTQRRTAMTESPFTDEDRAYADDMGFGTCEKCASMYPYESLVDGEHVCEVPLT